MTIFGSRHLQCRVSTSAASEKAWEVFPQRPGSFYIGNLCAPWHRVRHFQEQAGDVEMFRPLCGAATHVHVVVMLRTDVFRALQSRATKSRPKPVEVFDIVNEVVASALSGQPLSFPDLASCLEEHFELVQRFSLSQTGTGNLERQFGRQ